MAGKNAKKELSFEQGLKQLEAIAEQLEQGEQPLDGLMKLYEEGMTLSKRLTKQLDEMDSRMREVREGKNGEPETVPTDVAKQESLFDA